MFVNVLTIFGDALKRIHNNICKSLSSKVNRTRPVKDKEIRHKTQHYLLRPKEKGTKRHDKTKIERKTDIKWHGKTDHNYTLSIHHHQSTSFVNNLKFIANYNFQQQRVSRSRTSKQMVRFTSRGHKDPTPTNDSTTSRVQMKSRKEVRKQVSIGTPRFANPNRTEQCEDLSTEEYSDRSASSGPSLVRQKSFSPNTLWLATHGKSQTVLYLVTMSVVSM